MTAHDQNASSSARVMSRALAGVEVEHLHRQGRNPAISAGQVGLCCGALVGVPGVVESLSEGRGRCCREQRGLVGAMVFGDGDQRGQVRQSVPDALMDLGGVLLLDLDEPARVARGAPGMGTAHGAQDASSWAHSWRSR